MMILFDNMLSEKYEMLDCKILNEKCVQKATYETQINKEFDIQSLSFFICRTRLLSYGFHTRKNQI